ncbi:MAG: polysaccharide deacetylase family protein [Lachnospiraceae bacterium]
MRRSGHTGSMDRSVRVRLIKRGIIGLLAFVLMLPTVLCVILFCKFERLEKQLQEIVSAKEEVITETEDTRLMHVGAKNSTEPYITVVSEEGIAETKPLNNETNEKPEKKVSGNSVSGDEVSANNMVSRAEMVSGAAEYILKSEEGVSLNAVTVPERTDWPKKVYLTFDDGPSRNTDAILNILNSYGVKGNFFVVATENKDLHVMYRRIVEEGHVIGMHSYSHKYNEVYASKEAFINDLSKIQSLIYEETGVLTDIYRFPGGSSNTVSRLDMSVFIGVLKDRDITYYDWNISSRDTSSPMPDKEKIVENCLTGIQNYEEAMILMHDLGNKTSTVEALPEIIERLLEMGVEIAPMDENTMHIQHTNIQ